MISLSQVSIRQGAFAVQDIAIEVPTGAYGVLMGKTGSGKTTLLEAICGLRPVAAGSVRLMGRDVTRLKPAIRNIGYVPQDIALFSTLSVREHLAFALVVRRWGRAAIRARVEELAGLLANRALAGPQAPRAERRRGAARGPGPRHRHAPGRPLVRRTARALDDDTRREVHELLRSIRRRCRLPSCTSRTIATKPRGWATASFNFATGEFARSRGDDTIAQRDNPS